VTVAQQLSSLINLSMNTGVFPDSLKVAQVTPIHKKNDSLNKSNLNKRGPRIYLGALLYGCQLSYSVLC
jgi:hypothetical protein